MDQLLRIPSRPETAHHPNIKVLPVHDTPMIYLDHRTTTSRSGTRQVVIDTF